MADQWWLLFSIGLAVGALGTLIGAGGGFILVPVLLLLMPQVGTVGIASISLAVVFVKSASGAIAYLRMQRIDVKSAVWFSLATIPSAILGALGTKFIPPSQFYVLFGYVLLVASVFLLWKPEAAKLPDEQPKPRHTRREFTDSHGVTHTYSFFLPYGIAFSMVIEFLASLLGIGGGFFYVPILNRILNFPVHIAAATSQVILGVAALSATVVHVARGDLSGHWHVLLILGSASIIGAQFGAQFSTKVHGTWIMRVLAVALGLVGIRILLKG